VKQGISEDWPKKLKKIYF